MSLRYIMQSRCHPYQSAADRSSGNRETTYGAAVPGQRDAVFEYLSMCRAFSLVSYSLGIIAIIATAATLPTSYNGALKYRLDMKHKTSRGKSEVWLIGIVIQ